MDSHVHFKIFLKGVNFWKRLVLGFNISNPSYVSQTLPSLPKKASNISEIDAHIGWDKNKINLYLPHFIGYPVLVFVHST